MSRAGKALGTGVLAAAGAVFGMGIADGFATVWPPSTKDLLVITCLFVSGTLVGFLLSVFLPGRSAKAGSEGKPQMTPGTFLAAALFSSLSMAGAAVLLAHFAGIDLLEQISFGLFDIGLGVALTVPLIVLLMAIMHPPVPFLRRFRDQQIEDFTKKNVDFGPLPVVLISLGAGISEELLFRGVLQGWLTGSLGVVPAVLIASAVFGVVHGPKPGYILVSTLIGIYLGTAYALTGSLLAVILAHILYDVYALDVTVREVRRLKARALAVPA